MEVHLRQAREADLPVLRAMEQALVREERPFDPTIRPDPVHYHDLPALLADPESRVLIAEADGVAVACGFDSKSHFSKSFIRRFGVPPSRIHCRN